MLAVSWAASTICSSVVLKPKLNRMELIKRSESFPNIATITCEGSTDPAVQAEPHPYEKRPDVLPVSGQSLQLAVVFRLHCCHT